LYFIKRVKGYNVPLPTAKEADKKEVVYNLPQRPARIDKILIRIIIILALSITLLFLATVFKRVKPLPPEIITQTEVVEVEVLIPEIIAPKAIISYDRVEFPIVTRSNEFRPLLKQYFDAQYPKDFLIRILLRDQRDPQEPTFLTVKSFLSTFSIIMPASFESKVDQESLDVFIHSQEAGNEIGFAMNITDTDGFTGMMREWEDNASKNVAPFFSLLEKEPPAEGIFTPYTHRQKDIRCLESNLCYSVITTTTNKVFIWTTSLDTIKKVIETF